MYAKLPFLSAIVDGRYLYEMLQFMFNQFNWLFFCGE